MHDIRQIIESEGPSEPFLLLPAQTPFNVSFRVTVPEGIDAVYGVEYTLDDLAIVKVADWAEDPEVGPGTEISAGGSHHAPVRAVRVNVEALSPGASIVFTVIQGTRG